MQISITGPDKIVNDGFQHSVENQLIRAFGSFANNILHIEVALRDERERQSRHCQIFVQMTGLESVTSEAQHDNPLAAVIRAAARARRTLVANLNRPALRPV